VSCDAGALQARSTDDSVPTSSSGKHNHRPSQLEREANTFIKLTATSWPSASAKNQQVQGKENKENVAETTAVDRMLLLICG